MNQDIDYRAVRREVEAEVVRRKRATRWIFFAVNFLMFVIFSSITWGVFAKNMIMSDDAAAALIVMSVGWLIGLMFQFISAMLDSKSSEERIREAAMGQAVGKHLLQMSRDADAFGDKHKREYSLSDDGELDPLPIEGRDDTEDITLELRDVLRQQSERKQQQE
ncbi:MAG: hypothetical protein IT320_24210 [Anaerolineae bacterium]|nr:hypothetical protein [Anaerolineae bacterium]